MSYPVVVEFEREYSVSRWAALVNWLLGIPHFLVLYGLVVVSRLVSFVSIFTILFTKDIPQGLFDFQAMVHRYQLRVSTYALFMRSEYPPFEFTMAATDPATDPAGFSVTRPAEYQRFMPLVKWLLAIPHYFVLLFLFTGAAFAVLVGFFAVLFTGEWPRGLRDYLIGVVRWSTRVSAYAMTLLVDEYPPFSLD